MRGQCLQCKTVHAEFHPWPETNQRTQPLFVLMKTQTKPLQFTVKRNVSARGQTKEQIVETQRNHFEKFLEEKTGLTRPSLLLFMGFFSSLSSRPGTASGTVSAAPFVWLTLWLQDQKRIYCVPPAMMSLRTLFSWHVATVSVTIVFRDGGKRKLLLSVHCVKEDQNNGILHETWH